MMKEGGSSSRRTISSDDGLIDRVFAWSIDDIFNETLFQDKVKKIPDTFVSVRHYMESYVFPLLEETRKQLCSSMDNVSEAPNAEVVGFEEAKPYGSLLYDVNVDSWRNRFGDRGKEPYRTLPGDIFVLSDTKPETVSDLQRAGSTWAFAVVTKITDDENEEASSSSKFKVQVSADITVNDGMYKSLFVTFLTNITTTKRIWKSLHMFGNQQQIIKEVLCSDSVVERNCNVCSLQPDDIRSDKALTTLNDMNTSQNEAVSACLNRVRCNHQSNVELIWGPPGTGKTKTISGMLTMLLKLKYTAVICAPTNVAVTVVASRVLKLVKEYNGKESEADALFCSSGDLLLFGNKERLKPNSDLEEIYLDHRVKRLAECFGTMTGWRHWFTSVIDFLEDCLPKYTRFLENESLKLHESSDENEVKEKRCNRGIGSNKQQHKSFLEFARELFRNTALPLRRCIFTLCTHIPSSHFKDNIQNIARLIHLLDSFETLLFQDNLTSEKVEEVFSSKDLVQGTNHINSDVSLLLCLRSECVSVLKKLLKSCGELEFPTALNMHAIKEFCFQTASLIFCTASSSYKLHHFKTRPLNLLVIDEAAQLRECESMIPLQLKGLKHTILIGDERQLPAIVESNISEEAGLGRSLFERLRLLGHSRHLLDIQYRMHPAISRFPNSTFYCNQISDAPNVKHVTYEKQYLQGQMFGPYSFINVSSGREERADFGHSQRNMVEAAIVLKLLRNLYKACYSKQKVSIGIISPYAAQVNVIREKLGAKYDNLDGFTVKVKSVDGFQGGEEDIIIISTVRSNSRGIIGFVANRQRTNVALTRARHCLWVLGNGRTLADSESIWEELVHDAKERHCFFDADDDKDLEKAILEIKKEYNQLDDLLNGDSLLFKSARWKVLFSDNFRNSFAKLKAVGKKMSVLNLLLRLSSGWRPKNKTVDITCKKSCMVLKNLRVDGLYILCSIDIVKELRYIQVLKVWDILELHDIEKLVKRLDSIFNAYSDDFIRFCNEKYLEGDLEVPGTWKPSFDFVRYKSSSHNETEGDSNVIASDGRCYVENSKVSDSLLLMKFYSLSSGVVSHLLSDRDGRELDLPFEVTDQELEIILFQRSTFILGRSGTGKTTVLTMKLFKKEQLYQMANEGYEEVNCNASQGVFLEEDEVNCNASQGDFLRQVFVTVSPRLCYAVKHHISHLKRFVSDGKYPSDSTSLEANNFDDETPSRDIPDSLVDISPSSFPLVITFDKFLMMLDGTMGNSYFERFTDARGLLQRSNGGLESIALQSFIRTRQVNFDKFCLNYWPHFNSRMTKNLDSSRVFTEIISHIKGGSQSMKSSDGKLSREDYVGLSKSRICTLNSQKREVIYDIFLDYEKLKTEKYEFDIADLVIDLHHRLKNGKYTGDRIDFVYIDEVQDLTMSQIALFKYICQNVEEGFVFSGDTAQTIARGIDFRFEDIRSLFYNEFILESKSEGSNGKKEKGQISQIFHLSQNFRTHDGVLRLGQSVIDLLYRFFPLFIDVLSHETSLIYGGPPIWLESGKDENAVATIFGNIKNEGGSFVGFGAEQVILVRDDTAKNEIVKFIGKQALVLTIVECKGLEFQDVLLYNFFSTSPLKNQWRVVYEYMNEQGLLDDCSPKSFPSFNHAKHNVLCSELKQLYVAITRTRQRFWICENMEEFSKPMFEYWKKKCLIEVRELDDSLAQAMKVASTQEEWKLRGYKLLREGNYEMATMCFEKAADKYGEKLAKATGLKAAADRMHISNSKMFAITCREAAEIFNSIGKAVQAAECFFMLEDYETAGNIYLEKCTESFLGRAGECFSLCGKYNSAAEVYARIGNFSKCLSCCAKGEMFEMGLQYIKDWKQLTNTDDGLLKRRKEMEKVEQEFLENCASHFHELNDKITMMNYVRAFHSTALIRAFLKSLGCLDDLLAWEIESGNFLEAAEIAKQRVELPLAADLLGKCRHYEDASMLILWYVFANSLWPAQSTGWPLKQFRGKDELLAKAKSFAKNVSNQFYEFICSEADILSSERSNILVIKQQLDKAQSHKSIRGEILSARKILDSHFHINTSKYLWENEMILDLTRHSDVLLKNNQVSVETLVYFWNFWKDKVVQIFEFLKHVETQDVIEYKRYGDFCLNYLGVRRQYNNIGTLYILLKPDSEWVRNDRKLMQQKGNLFSIGVYRLVSAARNYWCSELFSAGMRVLKNLEALYKYSTEKNYSFFQQSRLLTHIYEVVNFLLKPEFLSSRWSNAGTLQEIMRLSTVNIFGHIFPLNWKEALRDNMIHLRRTEGLQKLLEEVALEIISSKNKIYYGEIGRLALIILGTGKLKSEIYLRIAERLSWSPSWNNFYKNLNGIQNFHEVVVDTYNANWRGKDYISPGCFMYLLERYVFLFSRLTLTKEHMYTTKFSLIEWLICQEGNTQSASGLVIDYLDQPCLEYFLRYLVETITKLLYDENTVIWIGNHHKNVAQCYSLLTSRLIVLLCLLYLNFQNGITLYYLVDLLQKKKLPSSFFNAIKEVKHGKRNEKLFAKAFEETENHLVILSLGEIVPKRGCRNAIYVEMKAKQTAEDTLKVLVPPMDSVSNTLTGLVEMKAANLGREVLSTDNSEKSSKQTAEDTLKVLVLPTDSVSKTMPGLLAVKAANLGSEVLSSDNSWKSSKQTAEVEAANLGGEVLSTDNSEKSSNQLSSNCDKNEDRLQQMDRLNFWEILDALKSQGNVKDKSSSVIDASLVKVELDRCGKVLTAAPNGYAQNSSDYVDLNITDEVRCMIDETKQLQAALELDGEHKNSDYDSRVGELCKSLQSRRSTMEPLLNKLYIQQDIMTSVEDLDSQCCTGNSNGKTGEKASEGSANSGNNQAVDKKGKGSSSKSNKNKKGKGKGRGGRNRK